MRTILCSAILCLYAALAAAQYGDLGTLKIANPDDRKDFPSEETPKGSIVLLGKERGLQRWTNKDGKSPAGWRDAGEGVFEAKGGDIVSKERFDGSFLLHVEFRVPYDPKNRDASNSGVYVQGRYEVQVIDSYGREAGKTGCGSIYEVAAPLKNVCKAPTVWQSYDIAFTAPVFKDGKKTAPAMMTVMHNGVKIQDAVKVEVDNTRSGLGGDPALPGPIMLQDHGNPVQFRNIWLLKR